MLFALNTRGNGAEIRHHRVSFPLGSMEEMSSRTNYLADHPAMVDALAEVFVMRARLCDATAF